jgi:hypothetical protein
LKPDYIAGIVSGVEETGESASRIGQAGSLLDGFKQIEAELPRTGFYAR